MFLPPDCKWKAEEKDGAKKADARIYRSLVGGLLYLTATRPDRMFSASLVSLFMQEPRQNHFVVAKRVLKYLQGTHDYGIFYKAEEGSSLIGYTGMIALDV